jgi:hypothetical protein
MSKKDHDPYVNNPKMYGKSIKPRQRGKRRYR